MPVDDAAGELITALDLLVKNSRLLDCKYIGNPPRSPYILDIRLNHLDLDFLFDSVDEQESDLFRRYSAVISDPQTPAVGLTIITNNLDSSSYWYQWITLHGVPNARIEPRMS